MNELQVPHVASWCVGRHELSGTNTDRQRRKKFERTRHKVLYANNIAVCPLSVLPSGRSSGVGTMCKQHNYAGG